MERSFVGREWNTGWRLQYRLYKGPLFAVSAVPKASLCSIGCIKGLSLQYRLYQGPLFAVSAVSRASLCSIGCTKGLSLKYRLYQGPLFALSAVQRASLCSIGCTKGLSLQYRLYQGPLFRHLTVSDRKTTTDPLKGRLNIPTSTEDNGEKKDSQKELVITKRSRVELVRELERIDIIEFTAFHVTWNILQLN
jgi:uncharacterized membrane protein